MASSVDLSASQQKRDLAEVSMGIIVGLGLTFTLIAFLAVPFTGNLTATRDFVQYWAAGRQLVEHANPYDPSATAALERSVGCGTPLPMFNPPWTLPLVYPLGLLGVRSAAALWNMFFLGCVLLSVRLLRLMHGSPPNQIHWLSFAFTPLILGLAMGQLSILVLLGSVLFLRFHRRRPIVGGAALWLCALKPHLLLPFAAAVLAWIVATRSYRVLAGAAAAFALAAAAAWFIDPHAWPEYLRLTQIPDLKATFSPCVADAIRHWLAPHALWLRFLPAAAACVWAPLYYWRRRSSWEWHVNGNILILVSLVVAPYGWTYDQCCALPAILYGAYAARSRGVLTALAMLILLADVQLFTISSISPLISPLWLWTAPAWLAWYLFATRRPHLSAD